MKLLKHLIFIYLTIVLLACSNGNSHKGVIFRMNNETEIQSLDPAKIQGEPEHRVISALFEGLMTPDPKTAEPICGLAERWTLSDDNLTYTFFLRKSNWSDGVPVTAHDFEFGMKRLITPATGAKYAPMITDFVKGAAAFYHGHLPIDNVGIRALDDYTLQIELASPTPFFLELLTHYTYFPVPKHRVEALGDNWVRELELVSNGPFKLVKWRINHRIDVTKNEHYWDAENVGLDGIRFYPIENANTSYTMYMKGELDWEPKPSTAMISELILRDDYHQSPAFATTYILFNNQRAPFDDVRIRKALSLAINRKALTENVLQDGSPPSTLFVPPLHGYNPPPAVEQNVDEAKRLLAEAGYPNGAGFRAVVYLYNTADRNRIIAEYLQNEWKKNLNITVQLRNEEWKSYLANRDQLNYQMARGGWVGDYRDPSTFLNIFRSNSGMNDIAYNNPLYDSLIDKAGITNDPEIRMALLSEAENLLVNIDQAIAPLFFGTNRHLIDTNIWGGWYSNVMDKHYWKFIYKKQ